MKRLDLMAFSLGCGVAAALVCVCVVPALAQAPAAPAKPANTKAAVDTVAPAVRSAAVKPGPSLTWPHGPGSLSGVWTPADIDRSMDRPANRLQVRTVEGDPIPAKPELLKQIADDNAAARAGHPRPGLQSQCLPAGFPGMMFGSGLPHQTLESPGQVTMLVEELSFFRIIRLNVPQDPDPDPALMGHSVGHWEGDTLVVDTIGMDARTPLPGGFPHSEDIHVIEKYRRISPDRVEILMTFDDPKNFTKPWTIVTHLKLETDRRIEEYYCENNRNPPRNGATSALLQSSTN